MSPELASFTMMRIMVRLHQQITLAWKEGRDNDASGIARIIGGLTFHFYGLDASWSTPLGLPYGTKETEVTQ